MEVARPIFPFFSSLLSPIPIFPSSSLRTFSWNSMARSSNAPQPWESSMKRARVTRMRSGGL